MFLQKFESLVESCAINIYLLLSCFFPLGELLGDGRDPMATAAFLLFAITEKWWWWLACCREEECTPSRPDLQRVNWSENRLNLSIVQWQKKITHHLPSLSQMHLNVGKAQSPKPFISWQALFTLFSLLFLLIYSLRQFLLCQLPLLHGAERCCSQLLLKECRILNSGLDRYFPTLPCFFSAFCCRLLQHGLKGNSGNKKSKAGRVTHLFSAFCCTL